MAISLVCRKAVIKLGGSFITEKDRPYTVNWEALQVGVEQIKAFYEERSPLMVIVHGGGSFGHYEVQEVKRKRGLIDRYGVALIQRSMMVLSLAVLDTMIKKGLPSSLHPPHSFCKDENAYECNYEVIVDDLEKGLIPITYGDSVFSGEGKIISGDDLSVAISNRIGADCLIFSSNVEGVLDKEGKVIKEIKKGERISINKNEAFDVTGGILSKVEKSFLSNARNVRIVSGKDIYRALMGFEVGTKIANLSE